MKHYTKLYIDCHYYDCPEEPINSYRCYLEDTNPFAQILLSLLMDGPSCSLNSILGSPSDRDDLIIMDIESTALIHFNSSLIDSMFGCYKNDIDLYMVTVGSDRNYELTNLWNDKTIKISSNSDKFDTLLCILSEDWRRTILNKRRITSEQRKCTIIDHIHSILDYMNSPEYNQKLCWVV